MKPGQAALLVRLEHVDPRRRQDPEHGEDARERTGAERGEVDPARPRDEQHRRQRDRVDHRRPDVRLEEDEQHGTGREADRFQHGPALPDPPRAVGEEAGEEEDEQELPELRRLEAEEAQIEPALRVARDRAGHQHEQHHAEGSAVDHSLVAAVVLGVDEDQSDEPDRTDRGVDALPHDVVAGVAGDVVLRDPADRPEPVADERGDGGQQDPVEPGEERGDTDRLAARPAQALRAGVDGLDHPVVAPVGVLCVLDLKNCWKTLSAAGAAASAPKPPFSMIAQTTIFGGSVDWAGP